jgi:hypothetical protein
MRRFFLFSLLLFLFGSVSSQDLIITTELDSIECKVTKQDAEFVYFTYKSETGIQSVLMANEQVKELLISHFKEPLSFNATNENSIISSSRPVVVRDETKYSSVHFSGSFIFSRRIASISNELTEFLQDYYTELRGGRGFQGRFHVFVSPDLAIGMQVSTFEASHGVIAELQFDDHPDSVVIGDFNTNVSLLFIGPSIMGRYYFQDSSFLVNYTFAIGYLRFRQEEFIIDTNFLYEGTSFGMNGDLGLEYLLSPNVAIGIGVGYGLGAVSNMDITVNGQTESIDLDEPEGLARINFFTGLRFHF